MEGHGWDRLKSLLACCDRLILPWLSRVALVEYVLLRLPEVLW